MEIKGSKKSFDIKTLLSKRGLLIFSVLIAFLIYSFVLLNIGVSLQKTKASREDYSNAISAVKNSIRTLMSRIKVSAMKLDSFVVDIKHTEYQKLAFQREQALENKINNPSSDDYVKAKISFGENKAKVKMRLKGVFKDHWRDKERWSFRVKVRGKKTIYGMKHFSLVLPRTRNYIYEWLFQKMLKHEGLIAKRFKFVKLVVNGKDLGVYALEEHYSKQLIEHNQHREGPIIGFSKDLLIAEWQRNKRYSTENLGGSSGFYSSHVEGSQVDKLARDSLQFRQFKKAAKLLEDFRNSKADIHKVFDLEKLARFMAIKVLFGSEEFDPNDTKFYYNPVTARLEPVGAEVHFSRRVGNWWMADSLESDRKKPFVDLFFKDSRFLAEYIKELRRLSKKSYLRNFYQELGAEFEDNLNILYSEFPGFDFSHEHLRQNQKYMRRNLDPIKGLHAYFEGLEGRNLVIEVANIQVLPLEVLNLSFANTNAKLISPSGSLWGKKTKHKVKFTKLIFALPPSVKWSEQILDDLKINYKILGLPETHSVKVFKWSIIEGDSAKENILKRAANATKFSFISLDHKQKQISIKPGNWTLRQDLIVPAGYKFSAYAATKINLENNAKIISFSPLDFIGSKDEPIIIESRDQSGQGLVVMSAAQSKESGSKGISELKYVVFKNLSNPVDGDWQLSGAVTFYESPVWISDSQFLSNHSEDNLNIVRSKFKIKNSIFDKTYSDAFDADFSNGLVENTSFYNSGNDAIDVSGAEIMIKNIVIDGVGDKGLSAGENSFVESETLTIRNAEIAVVSKDKSKVKISDLKIEDSKVGFAIFQKKPEFGPASVLVNRLFTTNVDVPHLIEQKSSLNIDQKLIRSNENKVRTILYGVKYGKSTK